ncbi:MAG: hypothetical protein ACRC0L_05655, partial [Angustibacter sp.]
GGPPYFAPGAMGWGTAATQLAASPGAVAQPVAASPRASPIAWVGLGQRPLWSRVPIGSYLNSVVASPVVVTGPPPGWVHTPRVSVHLPVWTDPPPEVRASVLQDMALTEQQFALMERRVRTGIGFSPQDISHLEVFQVLVRQRLTPVE